MAKGVTLNNIITSLATIDLDKVTAADLSIPTGDQIWEAQTALSQIPQHEFETNHYFAGGVYAREMFIPKGYALVGKVHKFEHFFQIVRGKIIIWSDETSTIMEAPQLVVSKPGIKRVGMALEDTICINFHRVDTQDLFEIEAQLLEPDDTAIMDAHNKIKMEMIK